MTKTLKTLLGITPALGMAVGAVVLGGGALRGNSDVPPAARSLTALPQPADRVAPSPEGLSSVTVTRDWQEVNTSGSHRSPR